MGSPCSAAVGPSARKGGGACARAIGRLGPKLLAAQEGEKRREGRRAELGHLAGSGLGLGVVGFVPIAEKAREIGAPLRCSTRGMAGLSCSVVFVRRLAVARPRGTMRRCACDCGAVCVRVRRQGKARQGRWADGDRVGGLGAVHRCSPWRAGSRRARACRAFQCVQVYVGDHVAAGKAKGVGLVQAHVRAP